MSEEQTIGNGDRMQEVTTEQDENTVVLRKLKDEKSGTELDIRTPFVEREIPVPTRVRIPLYADGVLISEKELAELGLSVVEYTQAQLDAMTYPGYYAANPDLAIRVRQYKQYLDGLGLSYTATTDDIDEAIAISTTIPEEEKLAVATRIKAAFDNISLNLQALGIEAASYEAWLTMPKLIRYLLEEGSDEE